MPTMSREEMEGLKSRLAKKVVENIREEDRFFWMMSGMSPYMDEYEKWQKEFQDYIDWKRQDFQTWYEGR